LSFLLKNTKQHSIYRFIRFRFFCTTKSPWILFLRRNILGIILKTNVALLLFEEKKRYYFSRVTSTTINDPFFVTIDFVVFEIVFVYQVIYINIYVYAYKTNLKWQKRIPHAWSVKKTSMYIPNRDDFKYRNVPEEIIRIFR